MTAKYPTRHYHPITEAEVFGYRLMPGDRLRSTDVYDASNGQWMECPCPGGKLEEGNTLRWVRPYDTATAADALTTRLTFTPYDHASRQPFEAGTVVRYTDGDCEIVGHVTTWRERMRAISDHMDSEHVDRSAAFLVTVEIGTHTTDHAPCDVLAQHYVSGEAQ